MIIKLYCWFIVLTILVGAYHAAAQGSAFTYQGRLQSGGSPASGTYNLTFSLFNTNTGGYAIAGPVTTNGVVVSNGLFNVVIDFGSGVFTGAASWLEIGVESNQDKSFTTLTPRQPILPTPYAIFAGTAANANSVAAANITGTLPAALLPANVITNGASGVSMTGVFSGNGSGLTDLTAGQVSGALTNGSTGATLLGATTVNGFDVVSITLFSTNTPPSGYLHKLVSLANGQTNAQFQTLRDNWVYNSNASSGVNSLQPLPMSSAVESVPLYFYFVLDGSWFDYGIQGNNTVPIINVNGVDYNNVPMPNPDNNWYYYKVQFASSGRRVIGIKMLSNNFSYEGFAGVWIDPGFGWANGTGRTFYKLWCVGSSHTETPGPGAGISGTLNYLNDVDYGADLMHLFKNLDMRPNGSGGTGIVNPGAGGRTNFIGRISDGAAQRPDIIGIEALANDNGYTTNQFYTNCLALFAAITNQMPGKPIVVWTCPYLGTPSLTGNYPWLTNAMSMMGITNFIDTWADPVFPTGFNLLYEQAGGGAHLSPLGEWIYAEALANRLSAMFPFLIPSDYTAPTAPLIIPTGLSATAGSNVVNLSWVAPSAGANSYNVNRGRTSGTETFLTNVTTTSYSDTAVTNNGLYLYTVQGILNGSTSPSSYEVSATPTTYVPGPSNVSMQVVRWLNPALGVYADAAGTIPATNGQRIALWMDSSGNGNNVVGYSANYAANYINGQPAIQPSFIFTNANLAEAAVSNVTVAFATQTINDAGGNGSQYYIFDSAPYASGDQMSFMRMPGGSLRMNGNFQIGAATSNLVWYLLCYNNASGVTAMRNGTILAGNNPVSAGSMTGLTLGTRHDLNGGFNANGAMLDFIEYSGNPTANDIMVLSNYFANKGIHN